MELIRTMLIQELSEARVELLNFHFIDNRTTIKVLERNKETGKLTLRPEKRPPKTKPSITPYDQVVQWLDKWDPTFKRYRAFRTDTVYLRSSIFNRLDGYEEESNPEVYNVIRPVFVEYIDSALSVLDQEYEVRPLIEEYTKRVKSPKLAVLLNEFNKAKDIAPNHIGIGYRTILSLIIQEIAKKVDPKSKTATKIDLAPKDVLNTARSEHILSNVEDRLIKSFESTHKEIADLITHRPDILVDKSDIDAMVDLLNRLLPSIIN